MGRIKETLGLQIPRGGFYRDDKDMGALLEEDWRTSGKGDPSWAEELLPHARVFTALKKGEEVIVPPELQGFLGNKLRPSQEGDPAQALGGVSKDKYPLFWERGMQDAHRRREEKARQAAQAKERKLGTRVRRRISALAGGIVR
jgi:hypothetical protein